jgi:MFS family permease
MKFEGGQWLDGLDRLDKAVIPESDFFPESGDEMKAAKERKKMRIMRISAGVFAAMVVAFWLLILYTEMGYLGPGEGINPLFLVTLVPLAGILGLLLVFVRRHERALKAGMPLRDERSERIDNKAGRYAMTGTVWFLLGAAFYQMFMEELGLPEILLRHFIWIVFFLTMGLFVGFKLYFSRSGDA